MTDKSDAQNQVELAAASVELTGYEDLDSPGVVSAVVVVTERDRDGKHTDYVRVVVPDGASWAEDVALRYGALASVVATLQDEMNELVDLLVDAALPTEPAPPPDPEETN